MAACLVTGGHGFLGRHLVRALSGRAEVVVAGRHAPELAGARSVVVDLEDGPAVRQMVGEVGPELVFHLAGRTPPADPETFYRANTLGTIHLLDALRALGRPVRVVIAGSAAELGPVPDDDLPVGEEYPPRPADSYGLSKWLASAAGLAAREPLQVVVARIFNPIGPGVPETQVLGKVAARLAAPGPDPVLIRVGDLESRRDLIDVRDTASALIALGDDGAPGRVYHVGTGMSRRIGDGVERLIGLSRRPAVVEVDPALIVRPGPRDSRADIRRIVAETGWSPRIAWEHSLEDLWAEARARPGCH